MEFLLINGPEGLFLNRLVFFAAIVVLVVCEFVKVQHAN